jgi:hypothetical protein
MERRGDLRMEMTCALSLAGWERREKKEGKEEMAVWRARFSRRKRLYMS